LFLRPYCRILAVHADFWQSKFCLAVQISAIEKVVRIEVVRQAGDLESQIRFARPNFGKPNFGGQIPLVGGHA
jgi:hypothetical protein